MGVNIYQHLTFCVIFVGGQHLSSIQHPKLEGVFVAVSLNALPAASGFASIRAALFIMASQPTPPNVPPQKKIKNK